MVFNFEQEEIVLVIKVMSWGFPEFQIVNIEKISSLLVLEIQLHMISVFPDMDIEVVSQWRKCSNIHTMAKIIVTILMEHTML